MICPKCKKKINNDSKFCPRCGELFDKGEVEKYSDIYNVDYLSIYYPAKSRRVKIWGVSLRYMFFTYFYAIYEKMYLCALLSIIGLLYWWFIIPRFIAYTFMSYGFFFYSMFYLLEATAFIYLYYIFKFDKILLEKRKFKINKIIRNNKDKTKEEIALLVEQDSKGNKKALIITIIISAIVIPILIYYFIYFLDLFSYTPPLKTTI